MELTRSIFGSEAISLRLERLKEQHEAGQLHNIAFLKALLDLARDLVNAEKEVPQEEDEDRGKAALTSLFEEVRTSKTPIVVQRIVDDIDDIVRKVRFPEWQATNAGELVVLDEIVQVDDGLYLGKAHLQWWWESRQLVAYFSLVRSD